MSPKDRAQEGLSQLKVAVIDFLRSRPNGATHAEICTELGLESSYEGKGINYLSYSVLGLLLEENRVAYQGTGRKRIYTVS